MVPSVLILAISVFLLAYWFRYSCLLLLRSNSERAVGTKPAKFPLAGIEYRALGAEPHLETLRSSLDRDYKVLTYLLEHAAGLELARFENRLLVWDYKAMQWWYRLTKTAAPKQARRALREMASVIGVLAGRIDQRASLQTQP